MSGQSRKSQENRIRRIELVQALALGYYDGERLDRCYKEVWRRYVNPVYPMSYRTFLMYMQTDTQELRRNMLPASTYYRSDIQKPVDLFPDYDGDEV